MVYRERFGLMGIRGLKMRFPHIYQPYITRHRINCDGKGVSTLIITRSCHMQCKYCPNADIVFIQRYNTNAISLCHQQFDPYDLITQITPDELYFGMTGGAVVFGGGEPLLYSEKIRLFRKICPSWWPLRVETSLNVRRENIETVIHVFDQWFVDVKSLNAPIYHKYTGYSNSHLIKNLILLAAKGLQDKVIIRLPIIPGYNDISDINDSMTKLKQLGYTNFDIFEYRTDLTPETEDEEEKCTYLRQIRIKAAELAGIKYNPQKCTKVEGSCNGHCIGCDIELRELGLAIQNKGINLRNIADNKI